MDLYLKFSSGIKGEARDSQYKDALELTSFSHKIIQPKSATASTAGGQTAARVEHGDIFVTKDLDVSSPQLYMASSAGTTFDEATLYFLRADSKDATSSNRVNYLQIKLKNVIIASVSTSLQDEGRLPVDTIALRYSAIQWLYTQQNIAGGQSGSSQGAWNLAQNTTKYG
jgi:type VI secretion system secreted protein Hcp